MGFEEAIGFCIGDICFDKDGVRVRMCARAQHGVDLCGCARVRARVCVYARQCGAVFAEMANTIYSAGGTLASELLRLGDIYGHFAQAWCLRECFTESRMCCSATDTCSVARAM
jgi:hypothetical protein